MNTISGEIGSKSIDIKKCKSQNQCTNLLILMDNTLKILMTEQEKGRENMKQLIIQKEKFI